VLSPHGVGLDCHRTWESLALGHIVLVPSSSFDDLYTDLPVVLLRSWKEVTAQNLEMWLSRYSDRVEALPKKLTIDYWIEAMRAALTEKLADLYRCSSRPSVA